VGNDGVNQWDILGKETFSDWLNRNKNNADELMKRGKQFGAAIEKYRAQLCDKCITPERKALLRRQIKLLKNRLKILGGRLSLPLYFFLDGVQQEMNPYGGGCPRYS